MRIALFVTCLADTLFPDVGKATTALLERLGHEVVFPQAQTCCGQMHVNTGYQRDALPLVRRYATTFLPYDVIVAPSGSCVGSIRHQHAMVARRLGDPGLARRAEAVAVRTFEKLGRSPSRRTSEFPRVSPRVNALLIGLGRAERRIITTMRLFLGLSLVGVFKR